MTALLELPDELLELIISELDSGSLATCCRVSLDLLALASKVLYRDVNLTRQADAALLFCARNWQARASAVAPYLSLVQIRTLRVSLSTSSPAIPTALDLSRLELKEGSGKPGVLSLEHLVLTYPDHGFSLPSPLFPFLSPSKITFRDACTRISARDFRLIAYHLVGPGHAMPLASMCLRASVIVFEGCIPRSGGLHAGVAFPITHRQHVQVDLTARFSASLAADLSDQQAHGSNSAQAVSEAFKELWSEVGIPGMAGSSTLVVASEEHADWLTAEGEEMPPGMEVVVRPPEWLVGRS